jgi:hypothetical protein
LERDHQFRFGNHSGLAVFSDQARRIEVPAPSKVDQSPVNYKRVAEADGKEVAWDQIVKGHEYEKGKFVIIKDEDFARVDVEATQTVNIIISSLWTKSIRFFSISPITSKSEKVAIKHMSFFEML